MSSLTALRGRARAVRRTVRRTVLARRRLLAALCAGLAVAAGLRTLAAPPPPTVPVPSAAHDLPAGTVLEEADLRTVDAPPDRVPSGLVADAVGRTLASPLRAGEAVTDVRLVGARLATAQPGLTTMPVRFPDPGVAGLLATGDRVDLIATDPQGGASRVVAHDALVMATPPSTDRAGTAPTGAVVVLGVPPVASLAVAEASVSQFLSYSFAQ